MSGSSMLLGMGWGVIAGLPLARRGVTARARARGSRLALRPGPTAREGHRRGPGRALRGGRLVHALGWPSRHHRARARARAVQRAVPLAVDLLTVAARSGHNPRLALQATARWSPPALRAALELVERQCGLGASLGDALDELARHEPALREVAEVLAVGDRSGAPVADVLARLGDETRAALRRRAEAHARRVPVRLLFPLVFLVLPAFGLLTVVPALLSGLRGL